MSGSELAVRAFEQAWLFGARFHFMQQVIGLVPGPTRHRLVLEDGTTITARAVVLAPGATYRRLGIPRLEALTGAGVFYGATVSEAAAVTGGTVFVAGGGNSAGQAAVHLAKYAGQVTLLVRGSHLARSMSEYLITEVAATGNIDIRTDVEIIDGHGDPRRSSPSGTGHRSDRDLRCRRACSSRRAPHRWLPPRHGRPPIGWPLQRPPMLLETSVPGVFAVGDCRHRSVKRVAAAVGEGSVAITLVHDHLSTG